jgi:hypothetical protein
MSNSVVTSTVVADADGVAWANATWTAQLPKPFSNFPAATVSGVAVPTLVTGTLDANGTMTATLTDTSSLDQQGLQWTFTFQPTANVPAQSITMPVVGSTPNLTAAFSLLPGLRFNAGSKAYGYADVEVQTPVNPGASYFRVGVGVRTWNGTAWTNAPGAATYITAAGAIPLVSGTYSIGSTGALAMTLATPTTPAQDGITLTIIAGTAHAHTVTTAANKIVPSKDTVTYAAVGDYITLQAIAGLWFNLGIGGPTPAILSEV